MRRIADIVAHLLIYTRRAEGATAERLDVTAPIQGVFKILGEQLRVRGIEVTTELQSGLEVLGDSIRLEQIFVNLVVNARDALERAPHVSPKRIIVRTYATTTATTQHVVCEVIDNGCGIPERVRDRIFEPFFTTKEAGKGTGLGLSISRQIVEEHGGQIVVDSTTGGTTFRVLLPAAATRGAPEG
ncbi:MAG: ATP-binding protein [Polyangiaceae bacterium]|nr:ATP-binding protein [Polyangiaceae bacterium]